MSDIDLKISTDDVNLLLEGLGNLPFVKVYALISKIQEQAGRQLGDKPAPEAVSDQDKIAPDIED